MGHLYSEMIFKHGYIHCDPHPGNVLVDRRDGQTKLVLLDHGLYSVSEGREGGRKGIAHLRTERRFLPSLSEAITCSPILSTMDTRRAPAPPLPRMLFLG